MHKEVLQILFVFTIPILTKLHTSFRSNCSFMADIKTGSFTTFMFRVVLLSAVLNYRKKKLVSFFLKEQYQAKLEEHFFPVSL